MASMVHIGKEVLSEKDVEDIFDSVINSASSKSKPSTPPNEDEYDCSNRYRGLALIISNENFKTERLRRDYCDYEIKLMKDTFGMYLNFTVLTFKDLTAEKIMWVIQRACKQADFLGQSDCFACVLASHGGEEARCSNGKPQSLHLRDHCIYGVDHIPVTTKDIIDNVNVVEALKDKPKLFFIQACRSRMDIKLSGEDVGHILPINRALCENSPNHDYDFEDEFNKLSFTIESDPSFNAHHGIFSEKKDTSEASIFHKLGRLFLVNKNEPEETISILDQSCTDNTLVVYSSASEKTSYGRVNLGGWMLVSLKKVVEEQLRQANRTYCIDFMEVLNAIASNNAATFETHSQENHENPPFKTTVVFEHCFYKELNFYSNYNNLY
ncbi:uncharacterized protein LOC143058636 [Mytilus galloprovincialis]|uniref:uncharacterized protein LOC143058636 n=1 Tax=Mytilus galloprovincialis TaxID=29158 RepID=UPI003F7BC9FE